MAAAAGASLTIFCELSPNKSPPIPRLQSAEAAAEGRNKIVLQPRLCTLRSYGSGSRDGIIRRWVKDYDDQNNDGGPLNFFVSLAEYMESSRKSQDFEIVSGRFAMVAFAAAVGIEFVTGNSLFKKLELQQITEAAGLCVAVVALSATFAWFSSARTRIGQMFTLSCNQFVDSIIDNLIEGLFFDSDRSDWSDDI